MATTPGQPVARRTTVRRVPGPQSAGPVACAGTGGGGELLAQSVAILEWLEESIPALAAAGRSAAAGEVRSLVNNITCDIRPLNNLSVMNYLRASWEQMTTIYTAGTATGWTAASGPSGRVWRPPWAIAVSVMSPPWPMSASYRRFTMPIASRSRWALSQYPPGGAALQLAGSLPRAAPKRSRCMNSQDPVR